ncbi:MAG: MBL fold metallo-hydrolase [Patescibacteria group bacterium]|nr:MBL fold metallo-hydrolase [Patescibacteria group bacterium]
MKQNPDYDKAVEIADGVFWVGFYDPVAHFHCNPYLILTGEDAVLIDPGSNPHFPTVARKVASVVKFDRIRYIIIHHQDPDLASNIPVFEKLINRPDLEVVTTFRASLLTSYYGFKSPYRLVEKGPLEVGGRKFDFELTPYLHAPGAFTTYDGERKILFSSDIFGAFSRNWDLYAAENYPELMFEFHDSYMPDHGLLKNQMERFERFNIDLIAPQHGSVIRKELVQSQIDALKKVQGGGYLRNRQ